jgi:nicotinamide mononucleotide (NMN) deamidase PncC
MATFTPKQLAQVQPTTSYATAYTVPGATSCIVKEIVVCNTTGSAVVLDVSFVASGGTAGVANNVIAQHQIGAYSTVSYTYAQVMATGGFISIKAGTGAALTITISGVEIT